jgi:hypothetical protein
VAGEAEVGEVVAEVAAGAAGAVVADFAGLFN